MKFIVSSSALLKQLQVISGALSTNTVLPIIENFLFEINSGSLTVSATDLQTTMTTSLSVEAKENGKIAVPSKILLDTLKTLPEQPITFSINEENSSIEMTAGDGKYKLVGENGDDFPKIPKIEQAASIHIPASILSEAISKTLFAVSNDELRPAMTGVYCQMSTENLTFVATDAHKLVRYRRRDAKADVSSSFILPKKALNLLKSSLPSEDVSVHLEYNNTNAFFSFNNVNLICRLIDEKYPDYEAVIPVNNPNKLNIDRNLILSSLRRVSIFSNKTTHQVRLKISGSELQISAEDMDFNNEAHERLSCQYEGEDIEIGFNAKFLVEMLSNLSTEEVILEMSTPNRAGILLPVSDDNNEDVLMLVMPVMLNSYA
jgi:DNA polymerase III subunit beta